MGLIDTHQHLIYPDVSAYAWTDDIPELAGRSFTIADYHRLTDGLGVEASLFMETAADDPDIEAETRKVAHLASDPTNGIVGMIASCRPEVDSGFEAWIEKAQALGAVGFRRILHVVADEMSTQDAFRDNVRSLGDRDLTFDMCFLARQLPLAAEFAAACDNTRLVLDHCGVPDIAGGDLDPWRDDMRRMAGFEHVVCKLSGILAYCAPGQATYETIKPYVDHVLEVFGPDRIVWGSDWPVVDTGQGLPHWIEVTRKILNGVSEDEATAIAQGTARRVYGI
ncbi:MAG: amidohydrolase [Rhodobacteraceae bacterium]|nr:amidohydrolase [Paracoccaceae bacterium]